jgi:hypothetical protein
MIHDFLNVLKIKDYENTKHFIAPSQGFHPLGLFLNKHSEKLNFSALFYR